MGGTGFAPSGRQTQRHKQPVITKLFAIDPTDVVIPKLPYREDGTIWHKETLRWWRDVWGAPMAGEYTVPDMHGLIHLAFIVNSFWTEDNLTKRLACLAEIRLQSVRFGLSPIDRARLRWEVDKGEEADKRRQKRKATVEPKPAPTGDSPLSGLG
jgi:hypothetical protein